MILRTLLIFSLFIVFSCNTEKKIEKKPLAENNLKGWIFPENNIWWAQENGILTAQSDPEQKGSILWTENEYEDFTIELDFKFGEGTVDSGVFLRTDKEQIQIGQSGSLKRDMTASPYIVKKGYPVEAENIKELLKLNDWNTIKIKAEGKVYTVWLNGEEVLNYESESAIEKGPIGLQLHPKRDMDISFKNIKIENNQYKKVSLSRHDEQRKVDVFIDDKLFTSYVYPTNIKKPVLYPLITPQGTKITRKFPLEPSVGERVDHPHHVGVWFNYGDVNGLDFWNNSDSIKIEKRNQYGTIIHQSIDEVNSGDDQGTLTVSMDWVNPKGVVLLKENTTFIFKGKENGYSIDRITTLTALTIDVDFKDNKEGVLGIRVTRALELPSEKPDIFTDANGIPTKVAVLNNEGVNGNYINSEGIEGLDCWGKRADWVNLRATIGNENISLVILDHSSNVGYPTYWHARGYGLFAANPLGQEVFSKGKEKLNFKLTKGESVTFKHRIILASSDLNKSSLDKSFIEFSKE